jgi:surface antigen
LINKRSGRGGYINKDSNLNLCSKTNLKGKISTFSAIIEKSIRSGVFKLTKVIRGNDQLVNLIPHIGMILLVILVLGGSSLDNRGYFSSYVSLKQSILEPVEVKAMTLSLDKYTPLIEEEKSNFVQNLEDESLTFASAQGYLDQPQAVLAGFTEKRDLALRSELVTKYTVKRGDTVSGIAKQFNINVSTLRWANQLSNLNHIKPGRRLIVPARNGIWHLVKKGETISSLLKKFGGNRRATLKVNGLNREDKIYRNQKILIVGGRQPAPKVSTVAISNHSSGRYSKSYTSSPHSRSVTGSSYNRYPYGWCTWYVASRRNVPWSGNAGAWLYNAQAMGFRIGQSPLVGAIMVTGESWVGHVALVEAVYGSTIKVSEMNYRGWGVVSTRVLSKHSPTIKGYIY